MKRLKVNMTCFSSELFAKAVTEKLTLFESSYVQLTKTSVVGLIPGVTEGGSGCGSMGSVVAWIVTVAAVEMSEDVVVVINVSAVEMSEDVLVVKSETQVRNINETFITIDWNTVT